MHNSRCQCAQALVMRPKCTIPPDSLNRKARSVTHGSATNAFDSSLSSTDAFDLGLVSSVVAGRAHCRKYGTSFSRAGERNYCLTRSHVRFPNTKFLSTAEVYGTSFSRAGERNYRLYFHSGAVRSPQIRNVLSTAKVLTSKLPKAFVHIYVGCSYESVFDSRG